MIGLSEIYLRLIYILFDIIGQPPNPYDEHGCCVSCGYNLKKKKLQKEI